jgi:hypothetical protein
MAAGMQEAKKPETRNPKPETRTQEAKQKEIALFTTGPLAGK